MPVQVVRALVSTGRRVQSWVAGFQEDAHELGIVHEAFVLEIKVLEEDGKLCVWDEFGGVLADEGFETRGKIQRLKITENTPGNL